MTQLVHTQRSGHRWYATQIAVSCKKGDWMTALELLRDMQDQKMQPGSATCSKIITACIENKQLDSALEAMSTMRLMEVVPDPATYSTLIRICEKRGMADTAWSLFEDMQRNKLVTNVITYNALIRAAEELQLPYSKVEALLMEMKENELQLDMNSYNALISVILADSTRPDSIQVALDWFVELHEAGFTPNVITYKTLFGVLHEDSDGMLTEGIFKAMEMRGLLPDISTYNSLISSCERGKHPERALVLFDALQRQGLRPDRATYNALLGICKKKKQPERAARLLESMQEAGIDPDIDTYNSLIGSCGRKDQVELAIHYFRDLQAKGLEPNSVTFNVVFGVLTRREVSGEALDRLLESMACYGLQPDRVTYGHLFNACANNRDEQRAQKWLRMMRAHGIPMDDDIEKILSGMGLPASEASEEEGVDEGDELRHRGEPVVPDSQDDLLMEAAPAPLWWQLHPIPHKPPPGLTPQVPLHALVGNWYVAQRRCSGI